MTIPPIKHFGPVLVVWGATMIMLVFIRDLGSSLMFFGAFLALLYVATSRLSYVIAGLALFFVGATLIASQIAHVQDRVDIWLRPVRAQQGRSGAGQIQQSLFAQADGGLFGQGLGESLLKLPGPFAPHCEQPFPDCGSILPAPHTDEIFALIVSELGLFGGAGVIVVYALIAARGFKTAVMARDGFSKLLATGLTAVFALQAVVIIGGVVKFIPLTGVTLPFVSFGGSSVIANMILLGLLLMISNDARRPRGPRARGRRVRGAAGMNTPIVRLYAFILLLFAALVGFTSYWAVFDSTTLKEERANRRPLIEEQRSSAGIIKTSDGVTVAESHPVGGGAHPVYVRSYPQGSLFGNPLATASSTSVKPGSRIRRTPSWRVSATSSRSILDQLRGIPQQGDNVTLTINSHAQRVATQALQTAIARYGVDGAGGAVVALDPSTGAVKAMASEPGYDPNQVKNTGDLPAAEPDKAAPLLNRAPRAPIRPGSTMKVVTAAAALDSGKFTPTACSAAHSPQVIGGVPLSNAGGEQFGDINMTAALTASVNTYFAQVGEQLGTSTMVEYMKRFGFYSDPSSTTRTIEMAPSGPYNSSR